MVKTRNHGVLDTPLSRGMTSFAERSTRALLVPKAARPRRIGPRFREDDIEGKEARAPLVIATHPMQSNSSNFTAFHGEEMPARTRSAPSLRARAKPSTLTPSLRAPATQSTFRSPPSFRDGPKDQTRNSAFRVRCLASPRNDVTIRYQERTPREDRRPQPRALSPHPELSRASRRSSTASGRPTRRRSPIPATSRATA